MQLLRDIRKFILKSYFCPRAFHWKFRSTFMTPASTYYGIGNTDLKQVILTHCHGCNLHEAHNA